MTHPREKYFDPQNNHKKKLWINELPMKPQCHHGARPKRPTTAHDPLNLAHSVTSYEFFFYPFGKILKLKKRNSIISYCSISSLVWELFEIKGKQRIYLKHKLVKFTMKNAFNLLLPKLLCCYQENSYWEGQRSHKSFWSWNCRFLKVADIVPIFYPDWTVLLTKSQSMDFIFDCMFLLCNVRVSEWIHSV